MKNKVVWTIGILTVPSRAKTLAELLGILESQVLDSTGKIQLIVLYNNFEKTIGELRQQIVESAKGEYISFIDDDDLVPKDFCKTILPKLDGKADYVGFKVAFYHNGKRMLPVYHSLKYSDWTQDDKGYYRDISHLNPIKRKLALKATFAGNLGEDRGWADQLRGYVKKEHYIDREMYEYRHSTAHSLANGPQAKDLQRDLNFSRQEET